ncbi:formylglycine-generating enzyme family protein [Chryseolinea lacunae]|uniref:SUMF1/EgtB/PvdO family nonheme iron enzyme n=1 Tax=Chryseolinea lacunae TaxID=2801331 RepID=A0ABS1KR75_9BACT|nr:SUMF1/EgtB/PvdO family nonheme iron enzyme [Chryseolinea lacunae]MBL0741926.1 SUMF1/EgtB/PvdO family nonheme iron enzyme [Chryseolinea lacunae]
MVKLRITLLLILYSGVLLAGAPQPIAAKTKVIKPAGWYEAQAVQWQEETQKEKRNAASWMNYYIASRYAQRPDSQLADIVANMRAAVPGSFEMLCVQAWQEDDRAKALPMLEQAFALQPNNPATYASLLLEHEFLGHDEKRKDFSQKLFNSEQFSQALLHYSYNVLMSVEKDAVLFTEADHITLPILVLQDVMKIRPDVKVMSLDLLLEPNYRSRKLNGAGLLWDDAQLVPLSPADQKKTLCASLPIQNQNLAFYYTLTLSPENISAIKNQLYVVGLASQLSTTRLDNMTRLKENLENNFLLDYLTVNFDGESESATGKVLQTNYLVPMLLLHEHYLKMGDKQRAAYWESMVVKLASESGKETLVSNFLAGKKAEALPFVPFALNTKDLDDHFRLVKENVYAFNAELTNGRYNDFLDYLMQTNRMDLYEKCKYDLSRYEEPALSFMKSYHVPRVVSKKQKFYSNYPVINISYEAAVAYCEWLTEQYNNVAGRKFKKVKFRLPSVNEWQIAAASLRNAESWVLEENKAQVKVFEPGHDVSRKYEMKTVSLADKDILYPWFRYYGIRNTVLNSRGCSLGNFKFPDTLKPCPGTKTTTADGFWLMAPVESYFPNDIGLFDVVGNVAEMTNERGKACGGSWNHSPEESTIKSINTYDGPSDAVGFRVFMDVIEP